MKKVVSSLETDTSKAVIGLHSYSGCDSVSAFSGHGKVVGLKLITSGAGGELQKVMSGLGEN